MIRRKYICKKCKVTTKRPRKYKNKPYCYNCYTKKFKSMPIGAYKVIKLEDALNRVYTANAYLTKARGYETMRVIVAFPNVLAGKKFKIKLVGDVFNE